MGSLFTELKYYFTAVQVPFNFCLRFCLRFIEASRMFRSDVKVKNFGLGLEHEPRPCFVICNFLHLLSIIFCGR